MTLPDVPVHLIFNLYLPFAGKVLWREVCQPQQPCAAEDGGLLQEAGGGREGEGKGERGRDGSCAQEGEGEEAGKAKEDQRR